MQKIIVYSKAKYCIVSLVSNKTTNTTTKMKMSANEKLTGIETMKARIEAFHASRLSRIGMEWKMDGFRTEGWSKSKIIKEFRALPENMEITPCRAVDCEIPTPKTDAEMLAIIAASKITITIG